MGAIPDELDKALSDNAIYENLLRRLLEWDHFEGAVDGAYWRKEINAALDGSTELAAAVFAERERCVKIVERGLESYTQGFQDLSPEMMRRLIRRIREPG